MFIEVSEIRNCPGEKFHFNLTERVEPITLGTDQIRFDNPLEITLDVFNTGKSLVLNGRIRGDAELVCSRCLEEYPFHLDTSFEEQFCHVSDVRLLEDEGQKTEEMHIYDGNRIKLDDIITENIVLGIPMKLVCRENCRGLCAVCGANLNKDECGCKTDDIDPRLSALKRYFES